MKMDFLEGLTLVFLYLRLTGNIRWSWTLVFLPLIFDWTVTQIYREIKRQKFEEFLIRNMDRKEDAQ